jgi:hypothetical protein
MALLGLPPIDIHGPLHYVGIMDPLCGGTRSVHSLMSGDYSTAWRYNPIAFPLVLGAVDLLARHAVGLGTGRWLNVHLGDRRAFWGIMAALLIALEVNPAAPRGPAAQLTRPALLLGPTDHRPRAAGS